MASASSYSTLVQELYVAYFGRPADYFGLQNFEAALAAANAPTTIAGLEAAYSTNTAVKTLVDSFGTSAESTALYGSGSTESFVTAIFENLLNRAPAVAGLSFWVNAINSGSVTKGDAALAIAAGAAANTTAQGQIDATTIANKLAVAGNFTTDLGTSSTEIVAYSGAAAAAAGRLLIAGVTSTTTPATYDVQTTINNIVSGPGFGPVFNLTTGVDTIVGGPGNNTFEAVLDNTAGLAAGGQAATLNAFDTITGGTLNNTLNIVDFGTGGQMTLPAATITGITALNVSSLEGVNYDFSGWSTLTAANFKSTTGTDVITVGSNTALSVVDTSGNVTTNGGTTVAVTTDTSHSVNVNGGAATSSVSITGGAGGTIADLNHSSTTKANTITSVSITGSHNVTTVDSNALTSLTMAGESYGSITVNAAAGTRTLNLTMNGDAYATVYDNTATTVDVSGVTVASTPIAMEFGSAASISFNDAVGLAFIGGGQLIAAADKALSISGAGYFTGSTYSLNAAAVINASGSSGVDTIQLASASGGSLTQSFTGGSGQDIISIGAGQTGTVTGGSASNNEIVLSNAGVSTQAAIASVTHFSTFGVAGNTQGVFDMSKVSGYNAFDVQGAGGNVTFTNAATGSSLSVDSAISLPDIITLQTVDTTGATDTAHVTLGVASGSAITINQITLEDANFVGTGTVNMVVNSSDTITTFGDNNLTTLNISGAGVLNVTNWITDVSTSLTINNTAGVSATSTIGGVSDNYLTSLTIGGSEELILAVLASTSSTLTITDSDASHFVIDGFGDSSLTTATFANTVNTTAGTFAIVGAIAEAGLATLNLNGNVYINVIGDAVSTGITVAGGTDNVTVTFASTDATAAGKTDSITLGNGTGDSVTIGSAPGAAASTETVALGSGVGDSITAYNIGTVNLTVGSATSGTDSITANSATTVHVTAGNGTDVISATAATASVTIAAGTGANSVTIGAGDTGTISFGAHTGTDTVSLGASGTSLTAIVTLSGLNDSATSTDTITFSGDGAQTLIGFTQVTAGSVVASGGNTTLLTSWVAAADGATGSAVAGGAAHSVTWFQFQGNTYILEAATGDTGTMSATNTLVELVGTGYAFAHATSGAANSTLHLLG